MNLTDTIGALLEVKGRDVLSVRPDASVYEAIELMSRYEIGALMVMSGSRLEGMFSERDYARKVILEGRSSRETPVRDVMSVPVVSVSPRSTVDDCMRIMTLHRIRHLPVVERAEVLVVISIGDLVKWIITAQQETITQLHHYIAGGYPG